MARLIRPVGDAAAGAATYVVVQAFTEREALTACRNGSGNLELISWTAEPGTFAIGRGADSGSQAGEVAEVTLAIVGRRAVTAVRDGSDNLLLIPWDIPPGLASVDRIAPGISAGEASQIALVAVNDSTLVTALRAGDGHLLLISWRLESDGLIARLHDSGHAAGEIGQLPPQGNQPVYQPPIAMCRIDDENVVTAIRSGAGNLLLIGWGIAADGTITRWASDTGHQAGEVRETTMMPITTGDGRTGVLTAVEDGSGDLLLIAWRVSAADGTIERMADSGGEAGSASCLAISSTPMPSGPPAFLATMRRGTGQLELIAFELIDDGIGPPAINRTGDFTNQAHPNVGGSSLAALEPGRILAALQSGGRLKLTVYSVSPTRATLIRAIAEAGAGAAALVAVEAFSESEVLTACRNGSGNLELIGWNTEAGAFAIARGADSGTQAGEVGEVTLALLGRRAVTAVRDGSGNLLLIPWDVPPGLAAIERINVGAHAGEASQIALVALGNDMLVTALRAGNGNLLLISWRVEDDGSIVRLHDSGDAAGEIGQIRGPNNEPVYQPPVALCRIAAGNVITALRDGDGGLLLIGWSVADDGRFDRWPGDSGNQAGEVFEIAITPFAVGDFATDVVTAVRDGSGDLLLIAWRVSAEAGTIERIADSGDEAGAARCIAITTVPMAVGRPVLFAAMRRGGDNLELIAFELVDDDLGTPVISRTGDDTNRADTIVGATAITALDTGRALVALQLDGALQLTTYSITDASNRLAPADILQIRFDNPVLPDVGDGSWASNGIGQYPLSSGMEWVQAMAHDDEYDNAELVGASGWAIGPNDSGADVPFDHPFGFDWEFHVALDDAFTALLSPANTSDDRIAAAEALGLPATRGLLGLEWDKGLLPQSFRAQVNHGDRTAVFGRWILDTGHDVGDRYRTEIHPPLLVATASVQPDAIGVESTRVLFMSRPFLPGQRFTVDVGDAYSDSAEDDGHVHGPLGERDREGH